MKRLLLFLFVLLGSLTVKGQTFTFECICDYVTAADSNCDICNTNIQSRLFKGILIRKNATAFKWIDQPYIVQFQGNNATFKELIPNGETITITLAGTPFDSIPQYQDSIKCPCAGSDNFFIAGPGIYFSGDTISAFDISPINELQYVDSFYISAGNLYVSLDRDSVAASFVTLPVPTGAETIVTAGTGISVTGVGTSGSPYVVTNTGDLSTTNEIQTYGHSGTTSYTNTLSLAGGAFTLQAAGIAAISHTAGTVTITATEVDGSVANEAWTIDADDADTEVISNQTVKFQGGGIVTTDYIPGTDILTITGIEADGSVTNEAQALTISGTTSGIITLATAGGAGGGTATIAAGTGITVGQSGGTITITNSSPASGGWLLDGNTITTAKRIGSNDNFDVIVETNGTDRLWFDNAGTMSLGATQLTTAAFNINGLQTGTGMLIAGGSSLVGPNFYTATGSGTGSTATVLSGSLSMISGNVESILKNTATTGTGGGAVYTANVTSTGSSNDPFFKWQIDGVTDWSMGIDNDDVDNLKLHRFSRPSGNNGVGTMEFGYDGTSLGVAINKVGIGTAANAHYGLDVGGKVRGDQFVNNNPTSFTTGTIALGTAAGTGPTLDAAVSEFWGNGARVKFTSGTSPTANGVICTITLGTEYTFEECAPVMQGRSTNAGAFNYSCSFNSATRVITCTLVGTLTASTVYEFNLNVSGHN